MDEPNSASPSDLGTPGVATHDDPPAEASATGRALPAEQGEFPPSPPESAASDPWAKVHDLALKQLDRFMSYEPKVLRGDDPDAIHDMRVASRRLQQILDLMYPKPRPHTVRTLRRQIRRTRRGLGEVRNCDVLLAHVGRQIARRRGAPRALWTAVEHYLRERRAESFQRALRKLSKVNLAVFYVQMKTCLEPGPAHTHHHAHAAAELAPEDFYQRVRQSLERLASDWSARVEQSRQDSRGPVIHGARIATKRLRYLIEVLAAFEVEGSEDVLAWLRALQTHLGDWHDREVLEQMMIEMVARPDFLRDHLDLAIGLEKLILKNREAKTGFGEKYLAMTEQAAEVERLRRWVSSVLESAPANLAV